MITNMNDSEKDIYNDERISSFIRGGMSKEEEASFLNDLRSDADLRSRAVAMGFLSKAVNEVGGERDREIRDALVTASEDDVRTIAARTTRRERFAPLRRRMAKVAAVAALFVLLVLVGNKYYVYQYNMNLARQYQSEFVKEQAFERGEGVNADVTKELTLLYANVQDGNELGATIKRLSLLWELSVQPTYNDYSNYAPLIGWNLAIAHLKDNDPEAARSVLTRLTSITKSGSAMNAKANELLSRIK